ncbi:hypothetical protein BJ508DRAFT_316107 [Ascobolus immersus RN42]|uniref:Uncharacterized protein n=1 Tax=Ascobolus immersus RN42 TaxID=1160509 RepID=A0A3N4H7Q4_ASCIM|nr:hypothetical protein BJ508DRAFT_316107 [Ascobolus immersus RN42]
MVHHEFLLDPLSGKTFKILKKRVQLERHEFLTRVVVLEKTNDRSPSTSQLLVASHLVTHPLWGLLLRPGARLNAINGLRAPTSDVRLEIHVKTPNSSEGRARMDMWKAEGWGDDPDDEGRDLDSEDYVTKADYPFGLSFSYTGNRHGVRGFPKITLASAYRMLLLNGTECAHLIKYLKGDIKSRLMASGIRNKLSEPESEDEASSSKKKPTKSRAEKERIRKANDEAVEQWDNLIVNPLKEFKYLPPPIRDEFRYSPESVKYGKHGVIYTQASRCYTHCLDRIALEVASKLRSEEKLAGQDYDRVPTTRSKNNSQSATDAASDGSKRRNTRSNPVGGIDPAPPLSTNPTKRTGKRKNATAVETPAESVETHASVNDHPPLPPTNLQDAEGQPAKKTRLEEENEFLREKQQKMEEQLAQLFAFIGKGNVIPPPGLLHGPLPFTGSTDTAVPQPPPFPRSSPPPPPPAGLPLEQSFGGSFLESLAESQYNAPLLTGNETLHQHVQQEDAGIFSGPSREEETVCGIPDFSAPEPEEVTPVDGDSDAEGVEENAEGEDEEDDGLDSATPLTAAEDKQEPSEKATIVDLQPTSYVQRRTAIINRPVAQLRPSVSTVGSDESTLPVVSSTSPVTSAEQVPATTDGAGVDSDDNDGDTASSSSKKPGKPRPSRSIDTVLSKEQKEVYNDKSFKATTLKNVMFLKPFLEPSKRDDVKKRFANAWTRTLTSRSHIPAGTAPFDSKVWDLLAERVNGYSRSLFRKATEFVPRFYLNNGDRLEFLLENDRFATPPTHYNVFPNNHVMFLAPNIILFICRYFYANHKCAGNLVLPAALLVNKLNGTFICYMTSCLKMAIRCLLFDENYNTETHESKDTLTGY